MICPLARMRLLPVPNLRAKRGRDTCLLPRRSLGTSPPNHGHHKNQLRAPCEMAMYFFEYTWSLGALLAMRILLFGNGILCLACSAE